MIIEVWVVKMPNGDRAYTSAMPPKKEVADKWRAQGARLFKLRGEFPDEPGVSNGCFDNQHVGAAWEL